MLLEPFMDFAKNAVLVARADVVSCELQGGSALVDLKSGIYYQLNPTGSFVWSVLSDSRVTFDEIVEVVCEEFGADRDVVGTDVAHLLSNFQEHQLVEITSVP
eukprot:TRINITY_DN83027_c0_g1_i1.p1 TRINITY_DN83027_c0_g1~~TRINITY_DN83027_c0_g1_i1.p1  ORF type:complete len:103 (-),score=11.88 TRINITY_DN83027_c0_g1_i1:29-337(-)